MSTKLFVGNLSFNTTENDLQEAFAAHGTVVEANLMMDRTSGRSRGFAFVTMSTPEEAQKAIAAMNGATLGERQLTRKRNAPAVTAGRAATLAAAAAADAGIVTNLRRERLWPGRRS
ncbi:MAG: RNA-binding protein [Verrucomicrobiota bacterium]